VPITTPNLDVLDYATLKDTLVRRIPIYTPEWTDVGDADPGVTLIQLFSHLAEQISFLVNQVPDKNYVEFMRLLGTRLGPATPAGTRLSFILGEARGAVQTAIPAGFRVKTAAGNPPPQFETDAPLNLIPAQLSALVLTTSPDLRTIAPGSLDPMDADFAGFYDLSDVSTSSSNTPSSAPIPANSHLIASKDVLRNFVAPRFAVVWNGSFPPLKEMPANPLLVPTLNGETIEDPSQPPVAPAVQTYLWVGIDFNPSLSAGFLGQRVTLSVELKPNPGRAANAGVVAGGPEGQTPAAIASSTSSPPMVSYFYYSPSGGGSVVAMPLVNDTTAGWTQSGEVTFDVPVDLGPLTPGDLQPVRNAPAPPVSPLNLVVQALAGAGRGNDPVPHPLPSAIATHPEGWLCVELPAGATFSLVGLSFNVVAATAALTVSNELLGTGTGLPGQQARLSRTHIMAGTLVLAVEDLLKGGGLSDTWTQVDTFDDAASDAKVYVLDPEAGTVTFGDGYRGMTPTVGAHILARRYRYGGGKLEGFLPGSAMSPATPLLAVTGVTNLTVATGGHDGETLDAAKARVPKQLNSMERAVTADDYAFLARRTPMVSVGRALALPRLAVVAPAGGGSPLLDVGTDAPGCVAVVVTQDDSTTDYPVPSSEMLGAVCLYLNDYRTLTTELFVVGPQYARLHDISVTVETKPGYSNALVQKNIGAVLRRQYNVLTGGPSATGFPFGGRIHYGELVTTVMQAEGVAWVQDIAAQVDGQSPDGSLVWRRGTASVVLTACPSPAPSPALVQSVFLDPDENVFVDLTNLLVTEATS
jgi:predicted phage baseplate assembly protein